MLPDRYSPGRLRGIERDIQIQESYDRLNKSGVLNLLETVSEIVSGGSYEVRPMEGTGLPEAIFRGPSHEIPSLLLSQPARLVGDSIVEWRQRKEVHAYIRNPEESGITIGLADATVMHYISDGQKDVVEELVRTNFSKTFRITDISDPVKVRERVLSLMQETEIITQEQRNVIEVLHGTLFF